MWCSGNTRPCLERDDLDPEGLRPEPGGANEANDGDVLALLDGGPLLSREWETRSIALSISRRTYFRVKSRLLGGGHVTYDRATRSWSQVAHEPAPAATAGATGATSATRRTPRRTPRRRRTTPSVVPEAPTPTPPARDDSSRLINFDL